MIRRIDEPSTIKAHGSPPKWIEEFAGHLATPGLTGVSIARMNSPPGWSEPGQIAEFDEYTLVLRGSIEVETSDGVFTVCRRQLVYVPGGQWVRYSTPAATGAEYVAVCVPAFEPERVTRDPQTVQAS